VLFGRCPVGRNRIVANEQEFCEGSLVGVCAHALLDGHLNLNGILQARQSKNGLVRAFELYSTVVKVAVIVSLADSPKLVPNLIEKVFQVLAAADQGDGRMLQSTAVMELDLNTLVVAHADGFCGLLLG